LIIHRLGALPGSAVTFFCLAKLPVVIHDFCLFEHTRIIALYLEMYHMISLSTFSNHPLSGESIAKNQIGLSNVLSLELAANLRPDNILRKIPWMGTNKILPLFQFMKITGTQCLYLFDQLTEQATETTVATTLPLVPQPTYPGYPFV
jgi:hypothetical protein